MARFWVGGTGNWDQVTTTHWSATSGGAGGASVPTAADDVVFDASSGAGTVTCTANAPCRSIQSAGSTITVFVHNASVTITIGDATSAVGNIALDLSGFTTYTSSGGTTSIFTFASTNATQQTIKWGGKSIGNLNFSGAGSSYIFNDNLIRLNTSCALSHTAGTLDFNGKTVTTTISTTGATTRALTLTAATISSNTWVASGSNLTITMASGSISLSAPGAHASTFGPFTYYDVDITLASNIQATLTMNGSTFHNLTLGGNASKQSGYFIVGSFTVSNNYVAAGNSATNRIFVFSSVVGTQITATCANVTTSNCDYSDVIGAGAGTWSGASLGDGGNCSGITFTPPVDRFKVGGTGSWSSTTMWAATTGGVSGSSVPLIQDRAFIDANSGAGTFTLDMPRMGYTDWTNAATATYAEAATTPMQFFGTLILAAVAGTYTTNAKTFRNRVAAGFTSAGRSLGSLTFTGVGAVLTQNDNLACTLWNFFGGTYTNVSFDVTVSGSGSSSFIIVGVAGSHTVNMGSGTWKSTNATGGSTVWNQSNSSVTINPQTSTLYVAPVGAGTLTVGSSAVSWTLNNVKWDTGGLTALVLASGNQITLTGALQPTGGTATSLLIQTGRILYLSAGQGALPSGTPGNLLSISGNGGTATIASPTPLNVDYVSLTNIIGGNNSGNIIGAWPYYAGTNSVNGGGNQRWVFAPIGEYGALSLMGVG